MVAAAGEARNILFIQNGTASDVNAGGVKSQEEDVWGARGFTSSTNDEMCMCDVC